MSKRKIFLLTFIIITIIITFSTGFKIYECYNKNLIKVVENEFFYQAKKCYNEDKCSNIVYLKDLYERGYILDKLSNPISKKYYLDNSYVDIENEKIKLI